MGEAVKWICGSYAFNFFLLPFPFCNIIVRASLCAFFGCVCRCFGRFDVMYAGSESDSRIRDGGRPKPLHHLFPVSSCLGSLSFLSNRNDLSSWGRLTSFGGFRFYCLLILELRISKGSTLINTDTQIQNFTPFITTQLNFAIKLTTWNNNELQWKDLLGGGP